MSDYPKAYWSQYGQAIIDRLELKKFGSEYHGACPSCGGKDRFWITEYQGEVRTHCRQCGTENFQEIQKALQEMGLLPSKETNVVPIRDKTVGQDDFDEQTPYHIRKGIELIGAKLEGNNVVIPIFNAQKKRVGKQTIQPDGTKKFSKNMQAEGSFGVCGKISPGKLYVAEGYATCASIYAATKTNTIFALSSGNLPKVCEAIQKAFPKVELVVAADNDEAGIKAAKASGRPYATPKKQGYDWNDVFVEQGEEAVREGLSKAKLPDKLFTKAEDIEMTPPQWLIDGMVEQEALSMVFGASGAGKTFVVLDMALSVATGKAYHGKEVKQAPVCYIAGEGHAGFARRINAWATHKDVSLKGVPFYKSTSTVVMNDPEDANKLMSEINGIVQEVGEPKLIILDTMDRTLAGSDSDDKDVAAYLTVCDEVRLKYGATVIVVHHVGHNHQERARGSTRLKGRLDSEYRVEMWGDFKLILTPTKMKDAEEPAPMSFLKVTIGMQTTDGQETSSLALEYTEDKPMDKKDPEHIRQVILDQIKSVDEFGEAPRADLKEAVGLELECSQRTANRHIKKLIDEGVLALRGGCVVVA